MYWYFIEVVSTAKYIHCPHRSSSNKLRALVGRGGQRRVPTTLVSCCGLALGCGLHVMPESETVARVVGAGGDNSVRKVLRSEVDRRHPVL